MTNKPVVPKGFQTRPATGSFLDNPATGSIQSRSAAATMVDHTFERVIFLLGKRTLQDRSRPRA
jgi:hypothetical protein